MIADIRGDTVDSIGRTPLIRLNRASDLSGCELLGKDDAQRAAEPVANGTVYSLAAAAPEQARGMRPLRSRA